MKRLILIAVILLLASTAEANKFYPATVMAGGLTGALDKIDGAILADGDTAVVSVLDDATYGTAIFWYVLDDDSAAEEVIPRVIAPDDNAGDKRWILAGYWANELNIAKTTGVAGMTSLTEANADDTDYVAWMGPASIAESFSHQFPDTQPAGSFYLWATPAGTGDPQSNKVSAATLVTPGTGVTTAMAIEVNTAGGLVTNAANTISNAQLADNAVDSAELAAGAVDADHLNFTVAPAAGSDNYSVTYDHATNGFTLVDVAAGGGTDDQTLAEVLTQGADANDVDITSVARLSGVDNDVYIEMGDQGIVTVASDTDVRILVGDEDLNFEDGGANIITVSSNTGVDTINFHGAAAQNAMNLATTGTILGAIKVQSAGSTGGSGAHAYSPAAALMYGTLITIDDSDSITTVNLPDYQATAESAHVKIGASVCVLNLQAQATVIAPAADDRIRTSNGTLNAAAATVTGPATIGAYTCFILTDVATDVGHWTQMGLNGAWPLTP